MSNQGFKVRSDPKRDEIDVVIAAMKRGEKEVVGNAEAIYEAMAREAIEALDHHRRARDT